MDAEFRKVFRSEKLKRTITITSLELCNDLVSASVTLLFVAANLDQSSVPLDINLRAHRHEPSMSPESSSYDYFAPQPMDPTLAGPSSDHDVVTEQASEVNGCTSVYGAACRRAQSEEKKLAVEDWRDTDRDTDIDTDRDTDIDTDVDTDRHSPDDESATDIRRHMRRRTCPRDRPQENSGVVVPVPVPRRPADADVEADRPRRHADADRPRRHPCADRPRRHADADRSKRHPCADRCRQVMARMGMHIHRRRHVEGKPADPVIVSDRLLSDILRTVQDPGTTYTRDVQVPSGKRPSIKYVTPFKRTLF